MKRVIFVHGDKGGVGKTQVATRTAAAFRAEGRPLKLIDGDAKNPGLYQAWNAEGSPVQRYNVLKTKGLEELFETIATTDSDMLIDMPAGASAATANFKNASSEEGMIDLSLLLSEVGARAVVLFTINQNKEPIVALRDELAAFPADKTDWIVVLNHYEDRAFTEFDASNTKQAVLARGGKIADIARLDPAVTALMSREGLNLITLQDSDKASLINKIRAKAAVRSWIEQLKEVGLLA